MTEVKKVAVLDDGDNTTWSGDAILVSLTPREYAELTEEGDSKILRSKRGPSLQDCVDMLDDLCKIIDARDQKSDKILIAKVLLIVARYKESK